MTAMVQQLEIVPSEASEPAEVAADVPASPASLWTSESRAHYSITHVEPGDARAWIDCDCVIHGD